MSHFGTAAPVGPGLEPDAADVLPGRRYRPSSGLPLLVGWGFGVILPAVVLGVELVTAMCADAFFDPLPSAWFVPLVALVPISNLLILIAPPDVAPARHALLRLSNGAALVVAVYYSILFAPLMPIAAMALAMVGLGLLPLSPALAVVATAIAAVRLTPRASASRLARFAWTACGSLIGTAAIAALVGPAIITRIGIAQATSSDPARRNSGVVLLRQYGDESLLLAACYGQEDPFAVANVFGDPFTDAPDLEKVRAAFYRVTGTAFHDHPAPRRWRSLDASDGSFDADRGNAVVGMRLSEVSLAASRIDGFIDTSAAVAYAEWIMIFKNNSRREQHEARAVIALPPGGAVSRLTLWVNGEEREAAFGGRAQTQGAYQKVVRVERRDPVLITTAGPDRVMVQCFPVPPGGEMKIRFGVTAPLALTDDAAILQLPAIEQANYEIDERLSHAVWIESTSGLKGSDSALAVRQRASGKYELHGDVPARDRAGGGAKSHDRAPWGSRVLVTAARENRAPDLIAADPVNGSTAVIAQSLRQNSDAQQPKRLVIVLDGSQNMRNAVDAVADAVEKLPAGLSVRLLGASDSVADISGGDVAISPESIAALRQRLGAFECVGGQDNVPALRQGWDAAAAEPGGMLLWVHGGQPAEFEPVEPLVQRLQRRSGEPRVLALQAAPGLNAILQKLDGYDLETVAPAGDFAQTLEHVFNRQLNPGARPVLVRERRGRTPNDTNVLSTPAAGHVARLWALDEVRRLLRAGTAQASAAIALATTYQLVTPVSGAVALERPDQYADAGLTPAGPASVPTVPEPRAALVLMILAVLLLLRRRHRATA